MEIRIVLIKKKTKKKPRTDNDRCKQLIMKK